MIDRIIARLIALPLPAEVKTTLIADIRQIRQNGASVGAQNSALYRACGVVKARLPERIAGAVCQVLYGLTVGVSPRVVYGAIRKNRNAPVIVSPDTFADFINEDMTFSA